MRRSPICVNYFCTLKSSKVDDESFILPSQTNLAYFLCVKCCFFVCNHVKNSLPVWYYSLTTHYIPTFGPPWITKISFISINYVYLALQSSLFTSQSHSCNIKYCTKQKPVILRSWKLFLTIPKNICNFLVSIWTYYLQN